MPGKLKSPLPEQPVHVLASIEKALQRHEAHPLYNTRVSIDSIPLPNTYPLNAPSTALKMIADDMRALSKKESGANIFKGFEMAGELLVFAFKLGAFSQGGWRSWRLGVEQWLIWRHDGPSFDGAFFEALGALRLTPNAFGLTEAELKFDLFDSIPRGCPLLANLIDAAAGLVSSVKSTVREELETREMTGAAFARAAGISEATVSRMRKSGEITCLTVDEANRIRQSKDGRRKPQSVESNESVERKLKAVEGVKSRLQ